jgi:hypothetical protein
LPIDSTLISASRAPPLTVLHVTFRTGRAEERGHELLVPIDGPVLVDGNGKRQDEPCRSLAPLLARHGLLDDELDSGLLSLLEAGLSHRRIVANSGRVIGVAGGRGGARVQGLADEIDALQMIFIVNERAMFEFIMTEAGLREVVNRTRPSYAQWVYVCYRHFVAVLVSPDDRRPGPP